VGGDGGAVGVVAGGSDWYISRLTDEPTARMVQLWIEYDPHPPFGGIDWDQIDRDLAEPTVAQWVKTQLADQPDLLAKLAG
jgi:hypothetical protein